MVEGINFLRPKLPSAELIRLRRMTWVGIALTAAVIVSLGAFAVVIADRAALSRRHQAAQDQLAGEQQRAAQLKKADTLSRELEARERALSAVPEQEDDISQLVSLLARLVPPGAQLTQVRLDPDGTLVVGGTADTHQVVAEYLGRLRAEPGLSGVEFRSSLRSGNQGTLSFGFNAKLPELAQTGTGGGGKQ